MDEMEKMAEAMAENVAANAPQGVADAADSVIKSILTPRNVALGVLGLTTGIGAGIAIDRWVIPWAAKKYVAAREKKQAKKAEKQAKKAAKKEAKSSKPAEPAEQIKGEGTVK